MNLAYLLQVTVCFDYLNFNIACCINISCFILILNSQSDFPSILILKAETGIRIGVGFSVVCLCGFEVQWIIVSTSNTSQHQNLEDR